MASGCFADRRLTEPQLQRDAAVGGGPDASDAGHDGGSGGSAGKSNAGTGAAASGTRGTAGISEPPSGGASGDAGTRAASGGGASGSAGTAATPSGASGTAGTAAAGSGGASGTAGTTAAGSGGVNAAAGTGGVAAKCWELAPNQSTTDPPPRDAWPASGEERTDMERPVQHYVCVAGGRPGKAIFGYGNGCYVVTASGDDERHESGVQILVVRSEPCLSWQASSSAAPLPTRAVRLEDIAVCRAQATDIEAIDKPGVLSTGKHVGQVQPNGVCRYELYGSPKDADTYEILVEVR